MAYPALAIELCFKRDLIGLLEPKGELIGGSEIAHFSSVKLNTLNNEHIE